MTMMYFYFIYMLGQVHLPCTGNIIAYEIHNLNELLLILQMKVRSF